MAFLIGIDGGGTKTALCAFCTDTGKLAYSKTSGIFWRDESVLSIIKTVKKAVDDITENKADEISGIAIGIPCYGESREGDSKIRETCKELFSKTPVYLANDSEAGWAASLALSPGINIAAGTGSIAFGKDSKGKTARSGGWSEFFGDEGSCFWIGKKTMEAFSKQADGRIKKDELYDTVYSELKLENDLAFIDIIHPEYANDRKKTAAFQLVTEKAALAGSETAKMIYKSAVDELLLLVNAVRNQLDLDKENFLISYSGSLFKAGDLVLPYFKNEIEEKKGKIIPPEFKPEEGALLLAFDAFLPAETGRTKKILEENKR